MLQIAKEPVDLSVTKVVFITNNRNNMIISTSEIFFLKLYVKNLYLNLYVRVLQLPIVLDFLHM